MLGEGCREAGPGIEKLDRGQDKPGCLRTPVGWALEDTPRADRLQVPAEPGQVQPELAQQRRLLAAALPAGRGGASRAGLPLNPWEPAGESLPAWVRDCRSCRIRKCRRPRNVPKREASALPGATGTPNPALYTQNIGRPTHPGSAPG